MFNEARSRIEASLYSGPSNSVSACDNNRQAIRRRGCSAGDSLNHTEAASMSIVAGSVSDSQRQGGNMVLFLCSPPSMELLRLQQRKRGSFQYGQAIFNFLRTALEFHLSTASENTV